MTPGAPAWGASSCERPIMRAGCPQAGASSCERPHMRAGCPLLGASSFERPVAANPDLFPAIGEDPEAGFFESHWPSGTDGDCIKTKREKLSCLNENTDDPQFPQETVPLPLKRLRKNTPSHQAYYTQQQYHNCTCHLTIHNNNH